MKTFKQLEKGQGTVEYALMISFVAIVALVMITVFADPNDWRNGFIYRGIYRPVQCVVQGISQENCQDANQFSAIRYPSVADGTSRKLCKPRGGDGNPYIKGTDPWSTCLVDGGGPGGFSGAIDTLAWFRYDPSTQEEQAFGVLTEGIELQGARFDFSATTLNAVQSVDFVLTKTDDSTVIATRTDDDTEYTVRDRAGTEIDLAPGTYSLTAMPYSADGGSSGGGDAGTVATVNFTVKAPNIVEPVFSAFLFEDPNNSANNRTLGNGENIDNMPEGNYAIQITNSGDESKMDFTLTKDGAPFDSGTLTTFPYYIAGMSGTVPNTSNLTPGDYVLSVDIYNMADEVASTGSATFTIVPISTELAISGFRLLNANDNSIIGPIEDGDVLQLSPTDDSRSFDATLYGDTTAQSVQLSLTGPVSHSQVENQSPYTLFGDSGGNYTGRLFPAGTYTLTATAYSERDASGNAGAELSITFTVEEVTGTTGPEIVNFHLVDLSAGRNDVGIIGDGDTLDLNKILYNWNIRAETNPTTVGRVVLNITGSDTVNQTENNFPYHIPGDNNPLNLQGGDYTLTATAYDANNVAGQPKSINFKVLPRYDCNPTIKQIQYWDRKNNSQDMYIELIVEGGCNDGNVTASLDTGDVEVGTVNDDGNYWHSSSQRVVKFNFDPPLSFDPNINKYGMTRLTMGSLDPMTLTFNRPDGATEIYNFSFGSQGNGGESVSLP